MQMKYLLLVGMVAVGTMAGAQTKIEKTIPVKAGQQLVLNLDYPEARIQTWDKAEVLITGTVSINQGENDDAFQLDISSTPAGVMVTSQLKDKDNIPPRIMIKRGEKEYFFKASNFHDPEVQKFLAENGNEYAYRSTGIHQDIHLTIFVPRNTPVEVNAKYGMVEVASFEGPLSANSKYGGVDVTFPLQFNGQINATSQYGEIYTNLEASFDRSMNDGKNGKRWTAITTRLGNGPAFAIESKYGNIYLRKSK